MEDDNIRIISLSLAPENGSKKETVVAPVPQTVSKKPKSEGQPSLAEIQAKLKAANDEKGPAMSEVTTLQQEEEVSISGSNARLMIMQKLSRKSEVCYNVKISCYCLFL